MDTINIINLMPIFNFFKDALAMLGFFTLIFASIFLLYSRRNVKQFIDKSHEAKKLDTTIMLALAERYPDVDKNFIIKPEREQNVENNQLLQNHEDRLQQLEDVIKQSKQPTALRALYFGGSNSAN